ncbi:hypothetical protein B0H12DRAFT_1077760 [Mycena haematopus]|nr:hypothetical protein B0H12DRAFT_1077760 [Mycena haematopus]
MIKWELLLLSLDNEGRPELSPREIGSRDARAVLDRAVFIMHDFQLDLLVVIAMRNPAVAFEASQYSNDRLLFEVAVRHSSLWVAAATKLQRESIANRFRITFVKFRTETHIRASFQGLAPELHGSLASALDIRDLLNLGATCAFFRRDIGLDWIAGIDAKQVRRFLKNATEYRKADREDDYTSNFGVFSSVLCHPSHSIHIAVHHCWQDPRETVMCGKLTCLMCWMCGKSVFIAYAELTLSGITMVSHAFVCLDQTGFEDELTSLTAVSHMHGLRQDRTTLLEQSPLVGSDPLNDKKHLLMCIGYWAPWTVQFRGRKSGSRLEQSRSQSVHSQERAIEAGTASVWWAFVMIPGSPPPFPPVPTTPALRPRSSSNQQPPLFTSFPHCPLLALFPGSSGEGSAHGPISKIGTTSAYLSCFFLPPSCHVSHLFYLDTILMPALNASQLFSVPVASASTSLTDTHEDWFLTAWGLFIRDKTRVVDHRDDTGVTVDDPIFFARTFREAVVYLPRCDYFEEVFTLKEGGKKKEYVQTQILYWVVDGQPEIFSTAEEAELAWIVQGDPWSGIFVTDDRCSAVMRIEAYDTD